MNEHHDNVAGEGAPAGEARLSRDERLAAKLRENLRRRKTQARALDSMSDSPELPKPPATR